MSQKDTTDAQKSENINTERAEETRANEQETENPTEQTNTQVEEEQPAEAEPSELEKLMAEKDELTAEKEKLAAEKEELNDKYLRLAAEFDNYRKRTLKEKAELILNGGATTITNILPVVDDLERALKNMESTTEVDTVKEGVQLVYNKFMQILGQNGVKQIDTLGKKLDTDYMEAIAISKAPTKEMEGLIIDCVQTGYTLNETVIRHAKVVVGN